MNVLEMSNEFDVLYNNIMSNLAPGIDEYEKSLFLTRALDDILKAYADPRGNKYLHGIDGSEKRQIDFSMITCTYSLHLRENPQQLFDFRSKVYEMPKDCFIILNEMIRDVDQEGNLSGKLYTVSPISYQEYSMQMSKPYKYPLKNVVWRLITSTFDDKDPSAQIEIIGRFGRNYEHNEGPSYVMRYLRKPKPIILINLFDEFNSDLTIDNWSGPSECELDPILHHEIVLRAVELASASYNQLQVNVLTGIGNVSSTNLGIIPQQKND